MKLYGKKIGLLLPGWFKDNQWSEVTGILQAMGAEVIVLSAQKNVTAWHSTSRPPEVVNELKNVSASDIDALIITEYTSYRDVEMDELAMELVLEMDTRGKPIGAISDSLLLLCFSGVIENRRVTGPDSRKREVKEDNGIFENRKLVVDHNLVTCRSSDDLKHLVEAVALLVEEGSVLC